jgi:cell division protein FtsB
METMQALGLFVAVIVSAAGSILAWRKWGPERGLVTVTTADKVNQMTLRFAGAVDSDNDDLRAQIAALRTEFNQYRIDTDARLAEQAAQVRAARAGEAEAIRKATAYAAENAELRERVDSLEAEVTQLIADREGSA